MGANDRPVKMPELNVTPEIDRGVALDDGMKQVMAVIAAYWREKRITLQGTPGGALFVCSSQLRDIVHHTATGDNEAWQGGDIACSEVMVMGHPSNAALIWTRSHQIATVNNAWPLDAKEVVSFTITNLSMLHILIAADTERAIIAYTI